MKKKTCKKHLALLLTTTMLLTGMPVQHIQASQTVKLSNTKITLKVGTSKTLTLKNNKKKTTWKIVSGKKYVRLKNKKKSSVIIAAVKPGKAKVQAKAGKKKYTCIVTVKNKTTSNVSESPNATNIIPATQNPAATTTPAITETPTPTSTPCPKNENDVSVLQSIIQEQKQNGASVSENLDDNQYVWENERLTGINWTGKNLQGDLNVSGLESLAYLDCSENLLNHLNVDINTALNYLNCSDNCCGQAFL